MMQRAAVQRSSTFIDPESLKQRPTTQHMDSHQSAPSNLQRRKTLINLDEDEIPGAPRGQSLALNNNISAAKSVFGVDTLWEREMAKLKDIEAREKIEAEERRKREEMEDQTKGKKKKRKGKGKDKGKEVDKFLAGGKEETRTSPGETNPAASNSPPVLPAIQKASTRRLPPPPMGDDDDEESESDSDASVRAPKAEVTDGWVDSDEEREKQQQSGPIRTVGSGPRYPKGPPRLGLPHVAHDNDSDEEDVPLVATIPKAAERLTRLQMGQDDDSDEEKPLVALLEKTKLKVPSVGGSFGGSLLSVSSPRAANDDDEDEDDQPLGLRASKFIGSASQLGQGSRPDEDEDDKPLALHPDQMRRTQYMMAAQQQQQQQQFMMQAQAAQMRAQSMMYGVPSMMGSGFFGPPMAPPMIVPPVMPGTPPPVHDAVKYGRVDRWRQEVAVEGQPPT